MEVGIIFKIAAIGLITAIVNQLLKKADKDEIATLTTLAGLIIVLFMVVDMLSQLFGNAFTNVYYVLRMSVFSIASIGLITAFCVVTLKENRADIALVVGLCGGIVILLSVTSYISEIFSFMKELSSLAGLDNTLLKILFKVVAIGYVIDFSAGLIEESGAKSVAEKVVFAGKILIFIVSLPIIKILLQIVLEFIK